MKPRRAMRRIRAGNYHLTLHQELALRASLLLRWPAVVLVVGVLLSYVAYRSVEYFWSYGSSDPTAPAKHTLEGLVRICVVSMPTALGMIPLLIKGRRLRNEQLRRMGFHICTHCEYDLRSQRDQVREKCPECGASIKDMPPVGSSHFMTDKTE